LILPSKILKNKNLHPINKANHSAYPVKKTIPHRLNKKRQRFSLLEKT